MEDLDFENEEDFNPDFAFIGDNYVSKELLAKNKIILDTTVTATAIFNGEKWKVIALSKKTDN